MLVGVILDGGQENALSLDWMANFATGLPLAVYHVQRGKNFEKSSRSIGFFLNIDLK